MKVVINRCWGGFGVSKACAEHMAANGHEKAREELLKWEQRNSWVQAFKDSGVWHEDCPQNSRGMLEIYAKYGAAAKWCGYFIDDRTDLRLIQAIEELGEAADGEHARLKIVEIPDGTDYEIDECDGQEAVHERHNSWS